MMTEELPKLPLDRKSDSLYLLKRVNFIGRNVSIVLQNENGPCPLIAIVNVLILQGKISINSDLAYIGNETIITLLAEQLMESNLKLRNNDATRLDFEKNANDAISVLPKMQYGLDVNIKFSSCRDFEYTPECIIFDLLDIDLVHGWLADPSDALTYSVISKLSYNQVVECVVKKDLLKENPKSEDVQNSFAKASSITKIDSHTSTITTSDHLSKEEAPSISTDCILENLTNEQTDQPKNEVISLHSSSLSSEQRPESEDIELDQQKSELQISQSTTDDIPSTSLPVESSEYLPSSKMEKSSTTKTSDDDDDDDDDIEASEIYRIGEICDTFLRQTATQLTYYGLCELHRVLKDNQLCVFFRNNHFSTMFKYKGELYILITDAGFRNEPTVWEKLDEVDNDTIFCTANFVPYEVEDKLSPMLASAVSYVSTAIISMLPNIQQKEVISTEKRLMECSGEGEFLPSSSEVEQQLLIEQSIERGLQQQHEKRDHDVAMQLYLQMNETEQPSSTDSKLSSQPLPTPPTPQQQQQQQQQSHVESKTVLSKTNKKKGHEKKENCSIL